MKAGLWFTALNFGGVLTSRTTTYFNSIYITYVLHLHTAKTKFINNAIFKSKTEICRSSPTFFFTKIYPLR
jgi:hypothetical protein